MKERLSQGPQDDFLKKIIPLVGEKNPKIFQEKFDKIAEEFQDKLGIDEEKRFKLLDFLIKKTSPIEGAIEISEKDFWPEALKILKEETFKIGENYFTPQRLLLGRNFVDKPDQLIVNPVFDAPTNTDNLAIESLSGLTCPQFGDHNKLSDSQVKYFKTIFYIHPLVPVKDKSFDFRKYSLLSGVLSHPSSAFKFQTLSKDGKDCPNYWVSPYAIDLVGSERDIFLGNYREGVVVDSKKINVDYVESLSANSLLDIDGLKSSNPNIAEIIKNSSIMQGLAIAISNQISTYKNGHVKYLEMDKMNCFEAFSPFPELKDVCHFQMSNTILRQGGIEAIAIGARMLGTMLYMGAYRAEEGDFKKTFSSTLENMTRFNVSLHNEEMYSSIANHLILPLSSTALKFADKAVSLQMNLENNHEEDQPSKIMLKQTAFVMASYIVGNLILPIIMGKEREDEEKSSSYTELLVTSLATGLISGALRVGEHFLEKKFKNFVINYNQRRLEALPDAQIASPPAEINPATTEVSDPVRAGDRDIEIDVSDGGSSPRVVGIATLVFSESQRHN